MDRRPLYFALAFLFPFASAARAEEAPAPEAPAAEPAPTEPAKTEAPKVDDTSIFKDWKIVKTRGIAHAKTRAEFWAASGKATGKDLVWLGMMQERGELYPKAIETMKAYIEWKPPEGDAKAADNKQKNLELAWKAILQSHTKSRDWPGTIAAAQEYRKALEGGTLVPESWLLEGRAQRMAGDDGKAIEAFTKAADLKMIKAVFDLADVHLCNGDVAAAKAALSKVPPDETKGRDNLIQQYSAILELIGSPAPSLEKAVNVGSGEPPKDWSKPTVLYFWGMQTTNADRRLERIEMLRRAHPGEIQAAGFSRYQQYNPLSLKVEKEMTEEQEQDWLKKLIEKSDRRLPPMIVGPQELADGLKLRFEGQTLLVDKEGKFRWARLTDIDPYDMGALDFAVKKILAPAGQ